jgi:hypothetical protein
MKLQPSTTDLGPSAAPATTTGAMAPRFANMRSRANVDYALRTLQQSLVHFSSMADAKANIMLTVCSIVVTVSVTQWNTAYLRAPMIALSAFALVALVLAVFAAKPAVHIPRGVNGRVDPRAPGLNLLFFSHFSSLSCEEYLDAMDEMLSQEFGLYESILRDIYNQGFILARKKYRLLGYSYLSFLAGLVFSVAILIFQSL